MHILANVGPKVNILNSNHFQLRVYLFLGVTREVGIQDQRWKVRIGGRDGHKYRFFEWHNFWKGPEIPHIFHATVGMTNLTFAFRRPENLYGAPQGRLKIPLSRSFFSQITPRNCLKFVLTQVYPIALDAKVIYHAMMQFSHPIPVLTPWMCPIMPLRFPLGEPLI